MHQIFSKIIRFVYLFSNATSAMRTLMTLKGRGALWEMELMTEIALGF